MTMGTIENQRAVATPGAGGEGGPRRCVIVGAPGYSGGELVGILAGHPGAALVGLFGSGERATPTPISTIFPRLRGVCDLPVRPASIEAIIATAPDAVFLATPHEVSLELAPALLKRGGVVFDLSGAFRLPEAGLYPRHYGFAHTRPDLLGSAVYGLVELNRAALAGAPLVAVPGCYPTSAVLPLAPLVRAGAIAPGRAPIVNSISGVSGAGRKPGLRTHLCEVSLQAYDVFRHRHNPEIDIHAGVRVVFTPHLAAFDRGILSTIHVELAEGWSAGRIGAVYERAYGSEPFVRLLPPGEWPAIGAVRGTNYCDIGWAADEENRRLIVSSAIDNLGKGAAGQAAQCFNARFGMPETLGLIGALSKARKS